MYIEGPSFWGPERIYWKQETVNALGERHVDAEGGKGQCCWLRDPTKMTTVGYEPLQKYNRTPVSIQDKFSFCHRGPMGIENGK